MNWWGFLLRISSGRNLNRDGMILMDKKFFRHSQALSLKKSSRMDKISKFQSNTVQREKKKNKQLGRMIITKDFRTWNINDTSNMSSFNIHTSHAMDGHKQGSFSKPWEACWKMKAENVGLINVNHEKGKLIYNWKSNYKIYGKSRYYSPSNHLFFNYCFKIFFFFFFMYFVS